MDGDGIVARKDETRLRFLKQSARVACHLLGVDRTADIFRASSRGTPGWEPETIFKKAVLC